MRFLFLGAGAIGSYIGGSLTLAGHQAAFIERPETADRLRQNGFTITRQGNSQHLTNPSVFTSANEALKTSKYDVIVCALKSFDTAAAIDELSATGLPLPPVLSLQNGVENEALIAEKLGEQRVIAGTVLSAISKPGIGEVVEETLRGIGIDQNHALGQNIVLALNDAGLAARGFTDPQSMKWSKLLTNLQGNSTSAIFDMTPAELFADPIIFDLEMTVLRECLAVMAAQNLRAIDLPGTPVKALSFATRLPKFISQPLLVRALGKSRGDKMPSFHIDLYSGRNQTEVGYLNGAVARIGAQYQVPTPVNAALTETLQALTAGKLDLGLYRRNPDAFVAAWPRPLLF